MSDEIRYITLGWAIAYCCSKLDQGIDPRNIEVPEIKEALDRDIPNGTFQPTIKVSELRQWCEERIIEWEPTTFNQTESVVNEMKMILNKFC